MVSISQIYGVFEITFYAITRILAINNNKLPMHLAINVLLLQVCIRGSCVEPKGTLTPVHGGWSSFGQYGDCTRTCESGVRFRQRECNNPT